MTSNVDLLFEKIPDHRNLRPRSKSRCWKGLLNEFSESENGHGELKVFHFQNYKQMDDYFQQAA